MFGESGKTDEVHIFDLNNENWYNAGVPNLNRPRMLHAACALEGIVYVAGGDRNDNTCEFINLATPIISQKTQGFNRKWTVIHLPPFEPLIRKNPLMAPIFNGIMILGGTDKNQESISNGIYIEQSAGLEHQVIVDVPGDHIAFYCAGNQYCRGKDGSILTIAVDDDEGNLVLLEVTQDFTKRIVQDFGHHSDE